MQNQSNNDYDAILKIAWQRYAELDTNATTASKRHLTLRGWVIGLSILATLLAILVNSVGPMWGSRVIEWILRIALIIVPIIGSVILAFDSKFQLGESWLALRTGAEEIKKEIYLYRTILQKQPERHHWLSERLTAIQRQVSENTSGDLVLSPYEGPVPPKHSHPAHSDYDSGFDDLLADDYIKYRLEDQLQWHSKAVSRYEKTRTRIQIAIYAFGALSTFLAAISSLQAVETHLSVWVAFTTAIAAALTSWIELRRLDSIIHNYNKLVLELKIIRDHWHSLTFEEQTGNEFFNLVMATEKVLWSQHSKYVTEMRKAVADLQTKKGDKVVQVVSTPAPPAIDEALLRRAKKSPLIQEETEATGAEEEKTIVPKSVETEQIVIDAEPSPMNARPHAFVVMPFGQKKGPDGRWIDFNAIYENLIKPALEEAGFESFRADEESVSGDILTDMFQELLLADMVIADLSIDNANVFYELGVRHAMRQRGVVHIQSGRAYMPFDIFNVRTIPYACDKNGKPDPKTLEKDKQAIIKIIRETWLSAQERVHSPIFNLLSGLKEPERQALQTPLATGYWREYNEWLARVTVARRQKRVEDILMLTEEVSNPLIKEEAIAQAGKALRSLGHHTLALQQYRRGLQINAQNDTFRREEAFHLARLNQYDEAIVNLEKILADNPKDIDAISYLGRIYKEMWTDEWIDIKTAEGRIQAAYEASYLLTRAIDTYLSGYSLNQNHYYSGINALTLSAILDHLAQVCEDSNPEVEIVRRQLGSLRGAVQFTLEKEAERDVNNFWVFASLGDLWVCIAEDPQQVVRAYRRALALGGKSKFALESTLTQLELLASLNFRLDFVEPSLALFEEALRKSYDTEETEAAEYAYEEAPSQVFLFAGHMIDHHQRSEPRFPPDMEGEAQSRIEETLDKLNAKSTDLAIASGIACGGDILFLEACLRRGMRVEAYLPFHEAKFITESVSFAGDSWVERFYQIHLDSNVSVHLQPERLGPVPADDNAFTRNNRWTLYSALAYPIERIRLVVLWNGKGGDGPGGTGHMVQEVRRLGGLVEHLDTTKFDYWHKGKRKVEKLLDMLAKE